MLAFLAELLGFRHVAEGGCHGAYEAIILQPTSQRRPHRTAIFVEGGIGIIPSLLEGECNLSSCHLMVIPGVVQNCHIQFSIFLVDRKIGHGHGCFVGTVNVPMSVVVRN